MDKPPWRPMGVRDYTSIRIDVEPDSPVETRMRAVVDALWDTFRTRAGGDFGYSWIGFYFGPGRSFDGAAAGPDEMILGPRRDKPACSPIGLHGACGRSCRERRALVVTDVRKLGADYVACDPRDASEVVVPLFDDDGDCSAVLDVDSFDVGAFTEADAHGLAELLHRTALSTMRDVEATVI